MPVPPLRREVLTPPARSPLGGAVLVVVALWILALWGAFSAFRGECPARAPEAAPVEAAQSTIGPPPAGEMRISCDFAELLDCEYGGVDR